MRRTGAAHDGENHMVLMPGGVGANFRPDGQRTFVGMGSSIRRFYGDGDGEPVLETDAAGVVTAVNVSDPEGLAGRVESGSTRYYMFDAQGSVANETDASGNLVNSRYYDAYGWEARVQGPSGANVSTGSLWGWNARWGCYFDRAVGTYHMGAREYAPGMGRFLERDPIGFAGGMNPYAYCGGNPVGAADPEGLKINILASGRDYGRIKTSLDKLRSAPKGSPVWQMMHDYDCSDEIINVAPLPDYDSDPLNAYGGNSPIYGDRKDLGIPTIFYNPYRGKDVPGAGKGGAPLRTSPTEFLGHELGHRDPRNPRRTKRPDPGGRVDPKTGRQSGGVRGASPRPGTW